MKPLDLNLASRPFTNDSPLIVALLLLAFAAIGFSAYDVHAWLTADTRKATLETQIADHSVRMREMKVEAQRLQKELDSLDIEVLGAQADFVAGVLRERNFSWTRLFNDLEDVLPWNVRLIAIRPAFETGIIRLTLDGVARHKKALFDFEEMLEESARFSRVTPTNFRRAEASEQVLFSLDVRYEPAPATAEREQGATGERAARAGGETSVGGGEEPAEVIEVEGEPETRDAGEPRPVREAAEPAGAPVEQGNDAPRTAGRSRSGSRSAGGGGGGGAVGNGGRAARRSRGRRSGSAEGAPAAEGQAAGSAAFVPAAGAVPGTRAGSAGPAPARVAPGRGGDRKGLAPQGAAGGGAKAAQPPRERKVPEPADPADVVTWENGVPKIKLKPVPGSSGMGGEPPAGGATDEGGEGGDTGAADGSGGSEGGGNGDGGGGRP